MKLFRESVNSAQSAQWLGSVRLIQPPSFAIVTVSAIGIAAVLAAFACWGEINRKVRLTGLLVPSTGVLAVNSPQTGTVTELASLHEEVSKMPMAYHTLTGDMGSTLSGGQKQRILLARALYKQPKVLALDEATSHLDIANERFVSNSLKAMKITRFIIAHRPETIASCDLVIQLKSGETKTLSTIETSASAATQYLQRV